MRLQARIFILVVAITAAIAIAVISGYSYYTVRVSEKILTDLIGNATNQASINIQNYLQDKQENIVRASLIHPVYHTQELKETDISKTLISLQDTYKSY